MTKFWNPTGRESLTVGETTMSATGGLPAQIRGSWTSAGGQGKESPASIPRGTRRLDGGLHCCLAFEHGSSGAASRVSGERVAAAGLAPTVRGDRASRSCPQSVTWRCDTDRDERVVAMEARVARLRPGHGGRRLSGARRSVVAVWDQQGGCRSRPVVPRGPPSAPLRRWYGHLPDRFPEFR